MQWFVVIRIVYFDESEGDEGSMGSVDSAGKVLVVVVRVVKGTIACVYAIRFDSCRI